MSIHKIINAKAADFQPPDISQPVRKHPVHIPVVDRHNRPNIVFLTVCLLPRRPLLATPKIHIALRSIWQEATHWKIGYYMILPDHIHLFCTPGISPPISIKKWSSSWRRKCSVRVESLRGFWQRDCWDTQIRNGSHYERKLEYVRMNPVRAGLVQHSDEWPNQGHLYDLPWLVD